MLGFTVSQSSQEKKLLIAIKDYLCTVLGAADASANLSNLNLKDEIAIYDKEGFNNTKPITSIYITNFLIIFRKVYLIFSKLVLELIKVYIILKTRSRVFRLF